jgi:hypothetical protein
MYQDATKEKFSVLLIDYEADENQRYRKNFNEYLSPIGS